MTAQGPGRPPQAPVQLEWRDREGLTERLPLTEALEVAFEDGQPMRSFPSYRGQRNFPGLWWSSTQRRHVGYESWLERHHLTDLDHDPAVIAIASQPMKLTWWAGGTSHTHIPDFYARRVDGSALLVDCRPAARVGDVDRIVFDTTRRICEAVGWSYRLVHEPDPVRAANLSWVAGYRHPRFGSPKLEAALLDQCRVPSALLPAAESVGDPIRTLPVVYHLLWRQALTASLALPLSGATVVHARDGLL